MDTESFTAGPDAHLLKRLLEGAPTIPFTTIRALEAAALHLYDQGESEYLVCTSIPPDTFEQLGTDRSSILYRAARLYLPTLQTVRVTMPSAAHESAAENFKFAFGRKITWMGVRNEVDFTGGTRNLHNVSKVADGAWGPANQAYVTCALEVGMSASSAKLALDARLWLEKPHSPGAHVSQVVTVRINRDVPEIIFSTWELGPRLGGHGARSSLQQAQVTSEACMFIEKPSIAQASVGIDVIKMTGSLELSFQKLIERAPTPSTREADITFNRRDLGRVAKMVWKEQQQG